MKICQLACGDELHRYKKSLVLTFSGPRKVLSTGLNNGGCRTDLAAVFNNDGNPGPGMQFAMRADTYQEHGMTLVWIRTCVPASALRPAWTTCLSRP